MHSLPACYFIDLAVHVLQIHIYVRQVNYTKCCTQKLFFFCILILYRVRTGCQKLWIFTYKIPWFQYSFIKLGILYILIRSNKMQQYAGIYLLQNHSTCFGCPSHSSSGVHKTVTAPSGTGHSIWATTFLQRKVVAQILWPVHRGCSNSIMYSWWWVRWTPETCRVILQQINTCILLHLVGSY